MSTTNDTYYAAASRLAVSVIRTIDDSPEIAAALLSDDILAQRVARFRTAFAALSSALACDVPRLWAENPAPRCQLNAGHLGGAFSRDGRWSGVVDQREVGDKMSTLDDLRTARSRGERPTAQGADLRGANLRGADLWNADLRGANLGGADLGNADLRGADLWNADLRGADLWNADLRGANLRGADLGNADLWGADLWNADLRGANLGGADLRGANLRGADLGNANLGNADLRGANLGNANLWGADLPLNSVVRALGETPSGPAIIWPQPDGWMMAVGCWRGTPDELRTLIAQDAGWPEARGEQVAERRPFLEAILSLAQWHTDHHPGVIADLAATWGETA